MFAWAMAFALVTLAAGIAEFGARTRGELAITRCIFELLASAACTVGGVRRQLRTK